MAVSRRIELTGKVAIVTGAARGIGRACSIALAREGADLVLADLLSLDETVAEVERLGREALAEKTDVTKRAEVFRMVKRAVDHFGKVDILVNNAGTCQRVGLEETTERQWYTDIDTVLTGTFFCIQAAIPFMKRQGYGKIVNISSISGKIGGAVSSKSDDPAAKGSRSGPAYAAAKGGVIALTKWVAKDVGCHGIYVNAIAPGGIRTEMTRGYRYPVETLPISRMGEPEDVAEAVVFLASDASNYITGQVINVDGGWVMY